MITDKYYNECVFCGVISDQPEWIGTCVNCRRPLVQKGGNTDWLSITKRLLKTLERAELDEMSLIGVINYIIRQPELTPISPSPTTKDTLEFVVKTIQAGANAMFDEIIDKHLNWDNPKINKDELIEFAKQGKVSGKLRLVLRDMLNELISTDGLTHSSD